MIPFIRISQPAETESRVEQIFVQNSSVECSWTFNLQNQKLCLLFFRLSLLFSATTKVTCFFPGKYCIYKKGACPQGMSQGHVKWDDDDNFLHLSDKGGVLPDGVFGDDTQLYFCCRTDGNKTEPVSLPTDQPFFLLAYGSPQCQQVKWALATSEWIHFDVQDSLGINDQGGTYPYGAGINGHTIHYCHYQSKRYNEETG